jgi:hypothetical protein
VSIHRAVRAEHAAEPRDVVLRVDAVRHLTVEGALGPLPGVVPFGQFAAVTGWAVDRTTGAPPAGVCVLDDVGGVWSGTCDLVRDDVRSALGTAHARLGFEIVIPADALGRGARELRVWAYDSGGRRVGRAVEATVEIAAEVRPYPGWARESAVPGHGAVLASVDGDEPVALRAGDELVIRPDERVRLEGWAVAADGGAAECILLELRAGDTMLPVRYHPISCFRREKTPKRMPEPTRPDAWFAYTLDPSDLAPRAYALSAVILARDEGVYARGELGTLRVVDASETGSERRT